MLGPQDSDELLMQRYQRGDAAAFEILYRRHRDPVFRYVVRGCSDRERAAELFQEIWSSVIKSAAGWQARAKFTTWLYRLAHNRLVDEYRLRKLDTSPLDEDLPIAGPAQQQPEAIAHGQERLQRVLAAIESLPADQRDAFLLKEEGDMTLEEIGQTVGVGRETVKSRLRYALVKLRQELRDVL